MVGRAYGQSAPIPKWVRGQAGINGDYVRVKFWHVMRESGVTFKAWAEGIGLSIATNALNVLRYIIAGLRNIVRNSGKIFEEFFKVVGIHASVSPKRSFDYLVELSYKGLK